MERKKDQSSEWTDGQKREQAERKRRRTTHPPPVVRLCFRIDLFVPCSAFAVVGEDVSDVCFRLSEALDIEGVVLGPDDPAAPEGVAGTVFEPEPGRDVAC